MELVFLLLLVTLMIVALTAGYPVAFALPGASILAISVAALCGYLFAGDPSAYFAQDGPVQWLSAGVTNFRSLYWDVERDTLIAIPLFVFMGIMLQRSKIAEDLLVTMAQMFGAVPGGLGISVVFVGALLAATTGIVGATVIAMGLISLPAMLRNNYSRSLAGGTICAAGTLGQIIPPSIVLIILADQLSSAVDQAGTLRMAEYREATGEFSMPSEFAITSASAGDMFMGALIPGLVLVGIYMLYILVRALLRPTIAPPVPYHGRYDRHFAMRVALALAPPLALIFVVLGSIVMGVATVNQAGAIGAVGALIMGGYRLKAGSTHAYTPALLAIGATVALFALLYGFDLNIKNIKSTHDMIGITLALVAVAVLLAAIAWSAWRAYTIDDTLRQVMVETAKTTSMVFIILIGAAMLTSAFRGFGGEHLVKEFLTGLPGGFWTQFVVVMAVIFLLGFFLDFIEIAVVVVPIVAPILLADPSANITAVWLGVMIGLNIQTSFLTPPFGFALFYLRGVAPPTVKTTQIYKGAFAFILLQLAALAITGYTPSIVNYMPQRIHLTSDNAPPPINPRLQYCLEQRVFTEYREHRAPLLAAVRRISELDISRLPPDHRNALHNSFIHAGATFGLVDQIIAAEGELAAYTDDYRPLHRQVKRIQLRVRRVERRLADLDDRDNRLTIFERAARRTELQAHKEQLLASIPPHWETSHARYTELADADQQARLTYRRNVDRSYQALTDMREILGDYDALVAAEAPLAALDTVTTTEPPAEAIALIRDAEATIRALHGTAPVHTLLAKAWRALRGDAPRSAEARDQLAQATAALREEISWRGAAQNTLPPALAKFDAEIKNTIGLRLQPRLTDEQAKDIAACRATPRDISLNF